MASITKRKTGWRAIVHRRSLNIYKSKVFKKKYDAEMWARKVEQEVDAGVYVDREEAESTTLAQLMERYKDEITPTKIGAEQEILRFRVLHRDPLSKRIIATIRGKDIHDYIQRRLKMVTESTVNRELNQLGHVFTVAIKDWSIPLLANPVHMVRRPKVPVGAARTRRLEGDEEERLLAACIKENHWLTAIVILAIETAQRRGRFLKMRWENINFSDSVIYIPKEGGEPVGQRKPAPDEVPLSKRALEELKYLPRSVDGRVFPVVSANAISMAFKRACKRANIENLKFHDLRHEATSRMFEKGMLVMSVAAITGHKNIKMLMRYTHLRGKDLAKMLE